MTQQLLEPHLAAVTWSNHFFKYFIIVPDHCGGILAHFFFLPCLVPCFSFFLAQNVCCHVFPRVEVFSWQPFQISRTCSVVFVIVSPWSLTFNMLSTYRCDVARIFCRFSARNPGGHFAAPSTLGKIKCFNALLNFNAHQNVCLYGGGILADLPFFHSYGNSKDVIGFSQNCIFFPFSHNCIFLQD